MEAIEIVAKLRARKGQNVPIQWERQCKTLKGVSQVVTKRTFTYVRAGIAYENLGSIKAEFDSGKREEVKPLPKSDVWVEFPFHIRNTVTGEDKIRVYPATLANLAERRRVEYFIDGQPASAEEVRPLCLASEFPKRRDDGATAPACFTIKARDIIDVVDFALAE